MELKELSINGWDEMNEREKANYCENLTAEAERLGTILDEMDNNDERSVPEYCATLGMWHMINAQIVLTENTKKEWYIL